MLPKKYDDHWSRALWLLGIFIVSFPAKAQEHSLPTDTVKKLYTQNCSACHGIDGQGQGVAAPYVYPRPRNFTLNEFKFGASRSELQRTIREGIPGSSMPGFSLSLKGEEIEALSRYVQSFAGVSADLPRWQVPKVPSPLGSVHRGREHFAVNCASCHGTSGKGDGPTARTMKDSSGNPLWPRDLTVGRLKGGEKAEDVYLRIVKGIPGSPMPAYEGLYSDDVIWDMVAYVMSLRPGMKATEFGTSIQVANVLRAPRSLDDSAWGESTEVSFQLYPLWQRPEWPMQIRVSAVKDDKNISMRLSWADAKKDVGSASLTNFIDAVALMLPVKPGITPFIGMGLNEKKGDSENVVWIAHWRAMFDYPSIKDTHPFAYRDKNPWENKAFSRPAAKANNVLADASKAAGTDGSVLTYLAKGLGSLTPVNLPVGNLEIDSRWDQSEWQALFHFNGNSRLMKALDQFGKTWIALAVWDGNAGDRNGQKSITTWVPLEVK